MKKIGIIFAMEEELNALKKYLTITKEYNIFELKFYESNMNNIDEWRRRGSSALLGQ